MSRIAVFDIGTVTCRLGVFDVTNQRIAQTVYKDLEICNLGSNVDSTNTLDTLAIERVLSCVEKFILKVRTLGVDGCICTLTSAARDAQNANVLLDRLRALGIEPDIISGDIEAQLSFLGVAQSFPDEVIAVMDSGGGSTEICIGSLSSSHELSIQWVHSYNIGARRLTDRFFPQGKDYTEENREATLTYAQDSYLQCMPPFSCKNIRLVGVGGTATTLSAINQKLEVYNPELIHLSSLTYEQIDRMGSWLCQLTDQMRKQVPGLQPKRSEVIVGGICAVEALMRAYGADTLVVSENDILCGLAIIADSSFKYEENVVKWNPQLFNL